MIQILNTQKPYFKAITILYRNPGNHPKNEEFMIILKRPIQKTSKQGNTQINTKLKQKVQRIQNNTETPNKHLQVDEFSKVLR